MREATGIFDRVSGVGRSVRLTPSFRPAYLLAFLSLLIPNAVSAQSKAEWDQYKIKCGIPASMAYTDWQAQGSHCPKTESASSTSPAVPSLNPQQQLAMQGAALAGNMIGQALGQLLFGKPTPPTEPAQRDPEQQQRELAAQQLNNSGLYLLKQRNYAGAINEFQKALATIPNDSNTLHNLAMAKQRQKDAAVAGQTSGALGELLGNAPANTGLFGFAQLTGSTAANPNASALSLVNLDSDANNVVDLRGTTKTSVDPESLKGQLDGVLGNNAPASEERGSQFVLPQDKDIELLTTLSQSGGSQSQVVPPQNKDMELLSTLSETRAPQSHVVLPQDKDMELLGFPASSSESDLNNSKSSAPATANNVSNNSALNSVGASTPAQTPASGPSLRDAVGDRPTRASGGTTNAFGTTSNPSNPDLNSSAPAPTVAVHSAHDQLGSAANSGAAATVNTRSDAAKVELSCVFDKSACETSAPAAVRAVPATPSASADLQIPAKMLNDPEVRMLNRYKQQAQEAHKAAAAAQAALEAEQKKDPQSNQLVVLQEKAKEAQDHAGSQDNMVKFQTGEVQKKIKFATINTGGDSNSNP